MLTIHTQFALRLQEEIDASQFSTTKTNFADAPLMDSLQSKIKFSIPIRWMSMTRSIEVFCTVFKASEYILNVEYVLHHTLKKCIRARCFCAGLDA